MVRLLTLWEHRLPCSSGLPCPLLFAVVVFVESIHTTLERKKREDAKYEHHASARSHQHDIEEELFQKETKNTNSELVFYFVFLYFFVR
jgi:hypothetical protein